MSSKNKKKNPAFDKKSFFAIWSAGAIVVVVALVMSAMFPKEKVNDDVFETEALEQAINEAETSLKERIDSDTGLTNVYNEEAVATAAEVQPSNTSENQGNTNAASAPNTTGFSMPVGGAVLNDYSGDELVYSKTMQDWRTHNGIDFAADEGTDVMAAGDGTVEAITDNSMMGTTVIILHSGGVRTIYSNLEDNTSLQIGDSVAKGAIIGKVGSSSALEASEPPHLHFEMSLNEETVSPHDYLTK